jgi:hypothetical protein
LNAVSQAVSPLAPDSVAPAPSSFTSPRNTLSSTTGLVVAVGEDPPVQNPLEHARSNTLPFDEEAKLVYGVIISLRNMVKKLSGRYAFTSLFHPTLSDPVHKRRAVYQLSHLDIQTSLV